jgi:hypothetical protein
MQHNNPAQRTDEVFRYCLYTEDEVTEPGEPPTGAVLVKGIAHNYGLHPARVAEKREVILALIRDVVPDAFLTTKGAGWSFLNLCMDRNGVQWTGMHHTMEALLCLGMAIGKAGYCLPREMWAVLPGSMPYVWFDTEGACN